MRAVGSGCRRAGNKTKRWDCVKWEGGGGDCRGGRPSAEKKEPPPVLYCTPSRLHRHRFRARTNAWMDGSGVSSLIKGSDLTNKSKANEAGSLGLGIELLINLFPSLQLALNSEHAHHQNPPLD
jgi:hypothetical protein